MIIYDIYCNTADLYSDVRIMIRSAEVNKAYKLNITIATSCASFNSLVMMNTVRIFISYFTLTICSGLESVPSSELQRRWGNQLVVEVPFYNPPHQKYSGHKVSTPSSPIHKFGIFVIDIYIISILRQIHIVMNSMERKIIRNVRSHRDQIQI